MGLSKLKNSQRRDGGTKGEHSLSKAKLCTIKLCQRTDGWLLRNAPGFALALRFFWSHVLCKLYNLNVLHCRWDYKPRSLKWSEKLKSNISWNTVFIKVQKIKDVKLKWLQMHIINRIIATNIVLNKIGVTANTQGGFCNDQKDSIKHMFWKCACIRCFWTSLEKILKEKRETVLNVKFTQNLVLFGTEIDTKTDTVFDLVIFQAKQFIYKCKVDKCLPTLMLPSTTDAEIQNRWIQCKDQRRTAHLYLELALL